MFYLSYYLQIMKKYYVPAIGYHLGVILVLLHFFQMIDLTFWEHSPASKAVVQSDYFHALIQDTVDINNVVRKIGELPGVLKIRPTGKEELKTLAATLAEDLGIGQQLRDISTSSIQVFFQEGLSARAKELIRSYLSKLAGAHNVNMGPITNLYPDQPASSPPSTLPVQLRVWPILLLVLLLQVIWLQKLGQVLAVVNKYQRRKHLLGKVWGVGHGLVLICCFPLLAWRGLTPSDCYWFWGWFGALTLAPWPLRGPSLWLKN